MQDIILISLCLSLAVQFIYACFWEGMIFGTLAGWLMDRLPVQLQKPLFACPICMTPYYSALFLAVLNYAGLMSFNISACVLIIVVASGFSTIFSTFYKN